MALAHLLLVAGGCWFIDDDDDHGTATATTTPECTTECEAGVCEDLTCDENNVCKAEYLPAGAMDDDIHGDCRGLICDGMGSWQTVITNDPPFDDRGDCHLPVCDESGGIILVLDQTDPPLPIHGDCQTASCGPDGEAIFEVDESDTPNDGNECTVDSCSGMTPVATPVAVNTPCAGGYCHPDGVCRPCPTFAECTNEPGEPNDSQASAYSLGTITDDDADGSYVCATLDGPDDVDWFVYNGEDKPFNVVNPTRQLSANAQARLCVYAQCVGNSGTYVSCVGETKDTAPQGQLGCCSYGSVTPGIECDGLDDSATIWIKVENQNALECVEYQLSYHF
ncbi:MAG: hypothetical protein KC420_00475 [Myxococcales bacterium]|nr:hypothetical protein [Myxococcales bacterium]